MNTNNTQYRIIEEQMKKLKTEIRNGIEKADPESKQNK